MICKGPVSFHYDRTYCLLSHFKLCATSFSSCCSPEVITAGIIIKPISCPGMRKSRPWKWNPIRNWMRPKCALTNWRNSTNSRRRASRRPSSARRKPSGNTGTAKWKRRTRLRRFQKHHAPLPGRPIPVLRKTGLPGCLQQYDKRAADVEELQSKLNTTRQQLSAAQARLQEQIRQVETRLDIDRIQRAEASNTKSKEFKVTENRQELLKLQTSLPQELERITRKGEAMIRQQTEAWEKAKRELSLFQNKVDRQIASIRDTMNSPLAEEYDDTAILAEDPEFQAMIAPFDQAVSHEESLTMRTEANVEEQAKVVHSLQRIRDGSIEEYRSRLKQEEQIFFTAATVIGAVLLVSLLLSFTRRK